MRDYGVVRTRFWAWAKERGLSVEAQRLAIYCLTSPHTNGTGCFRAPLAYIADDLGTVPDTVRQTLAELSAEGFLRYDEGTGWLWLVGFLEHNPIANSNIAKSLISFIDAVPSKVAFYKDFLLSLCSQRERFPEGYLERLEKGLANGMPTHEHEHDQEHDHDKAAAKAAPDLMTLVFTRGVEYLHAATGRSESSCRTFLGKCRKSTTDEALIKLLGDAQRQGIVEPIAWIEGAIRQGQKAVAASKQPVFNG